MEAMAPKPDGIAESVRTCVHFLGRIEAIHHEIQSVEVLPHLAGYVVANGSRVLSRFADALRDGTGIVLAKGEKFENGARVSLPVDLPKPLFFSRHDDQGLPSQTVPVPGLLEQSVKIHIQDARRILGPLDVS